MTLAARLRSYLPALVCALAACSDTGVVPDPQKTTGDVVRLNVRPDSTLLYVGQTFQFNAQGIAGDGSIVPAAAAQWSLVEGDAVSVTSDGTVTALKPGRAVISAKTQNAEGRGRVGVVFPGT